ncbi:hypothetical protein UY3_14567 [Chelonia mydas]|uniref:Uncharacterized protein n=1 Tax=Chelonia mydas TaxID=8469 RepID=M7AZ06_CHEMY|nr:hypothetical protein UY3_14567 [Chelonia mydas]
MKPELLRNMLTSLTSTSCLAVELLLKIQTDSKDSDNDIDEFILEDISLLRVTWEALLLQGGFRPGPYAACLCAAMVPPPLIAQWHGHVSLTGTRTTVALPRNLSKCIAQVLDETFEEITEADYRDVKEHINTLFRI